MNVNPTSPHSLRPVSKAALAVMMALSVSVAFAGDDDTPLSLTLSHQITRDSNLAKNSTNLSETINTTSVDFGLNKNYGRQNYQLSTQLATSRYSHYDQLNNDSKTLSGAFSSELLSNWVVRVNGTYDENLNLIENNVVGNRLTKNIRKYRDGGGSLQYGNGGLWAVIASYDTNRLDYSAQTYDNSMQDTKGLKLVYYSTDLLNFGLGWRLVKTQYVNRADLERTDKNVDFSTNWRVTGLSSLSAQLTRRATDYNIANVGSSDGWGGSLAWQYTPRGLVSYGLNASRSTGADRQEYLSTQVNPLGGLSDINTLGITDSVTTSLGASATLQATGKLSFGLRHTWSKYEQDNSTLLPPGYFAQNNKFGTSRGYSHVTSLSGTYAAMRSLAFSCSYTKYSQSRQYSEGAGYLIRPQYDGNTVSCSASFTLD